LDIEFNDASTLDTHGTGWFLGYSDWTRPKAHGQPELRYMPKDLRSHTLAMKWMFHPQGDLLGTDKPKSEGRTLSIMVSESGRFRLQFSSHAHFPAGDVVEHVLSRHGQFSAWGADIYHRWFVDEDCTILTLRWIPGQAEGSGSA
jgi:hypothetical protein